MFSLYQKNGKTLHLLKQSAKTITSSKNRKVIPLLTVWIYQELPYGQPECNCHVSERYESTVSYLDGGYDKRVKQRKG